MYFNIFYLFLLFLLFYVHFELKKRMMSLSISKIKQKKIKKKLYLNIFTKNQKSTKNFYILILAQLHNNYYKVLLNQERLKLVSFNSY